MDLGEQFQLFEPPSEPARKTEWADVTRSMRGAGQLPPRIKQPHRWEKPLAAEQLMASHFDNPGNTPLEMFLTPREIKERWAPAEGDRMYHGTERFVHGQAGQPQRKHPETGEMYFPPVETDEQFWERKRSEAELLPKFMQHRLVSQLIDSRMVDPMKVSLSPPRFTKSLAEHMRSGGEVPPIPLAHYTRAGATKPMVAGGTHRIATADPDKLLAVEHHENIVEAKKTKGYS